MKYEHFGLISEYRQKFDRTPDVSIIGLNDNNNKLFNKRVREAIDRGAPLTEEEEKDIEQQTFKLFYDERKAGKKVLM